MSPKPGGGIFLHGVSFRSILVGDTASRWNLAPHLHSWITWRHPLDHLLPSTGGLHSHLPKITEVQSNGLQKKYWFPWNSSEYLLVRSQLLWRWADKVSWEGVICCWNHWRCVWWLMLTTSGCHHILDIKLMYLPECCFPLLFHGSFFLSFCSI